MLELTLAYADTEEVEEPIEEALEDIEIERVEIDQIPKGLDHGGRQPNAHVLLSAEPREVLTRLENRKNGEQQFLADSVPEVHRVRRAICLERRKHGI